MAFPQVPHPPPSPGISARALFVHQPCEYLPETCTAHDGYICQVIMAYNRKNYLRSVRAIVDLYNEHKEYDVPDTYIIRNIFPKHNIYMSYRKWMYIKNMKQSALREESENQLSLFN